MEQIYTIPVNEAFEASRDDAACGCAFCALYRRLEENELDLILGASMMEPDVRIKTNKQGFCKTHYDMMFVRKNRLGMALTLESHLCELAKDISENPLMSLMGAAGKRAEKRLVSLEESCYVCGRIGYHFTHMAETAVMLWEKDEAFRDKLRAQPMFCLPHYRLLLATGAKRFKKKELAEFSAACAKVTEGYLAELQKDVSWFCKKFDYRYEEEPWYNSKDAVERAMKFLRSDIHRV